MSGLQIFNAHPRLYVGLYADHEQPVFEIGNRQQQGFVRLGSLQLNTTGVLGVSKLEGTLSARVPGWLTPLRRGRIWEPVATGTFCLAAAVQRRDLSAARFLAPALSPRSVARPSQLGARHLVEILFTPGCALPVVKRRGAITRCRNSAICW